MVVTVLDVYENELKFIENKFVPSVIVVLASLVNEVRLPNAGEESVLKHVSVESAGVIKNGVSVTVLPM